MLCFPGCCAVISFFWNVFGCRKTTKSLRTRKDTGTSKGRVHVPMWLLPKELKAPDLEKGQLGYVLWWWPRFPSSHVGHVCQTLPTRLSFPLSRSYTYSGAHRLSLRCLSSSLSPPSLSHCKFLFSPYPFQFPFDFFERHSSVPKYVVICVFPYKWQRLHFNTNSSLGLLLSMTSLDVSQWYQYSVR